MNKFLIAIFSVFLFSSFVIADPIDPEDVSHRDFYAGSTTPSLWATQEAFEAFLESLDGVELNDEQLEKRNNVTASFSSQAVPGKYQLKTLLPRDKPDFADRVEQYTYDQDDGFENVDSSSNFDPVEACEFYTDGGYEGEYEQEGYAFEDDGEDINPTHEFKSWWWNKIVEEGEVVGYALFPIFEVKGYPYFEVEVDDDNYVQRSTCNYTPGAFVLGTEFTDTEPTEGRFMEYETFLKPVGPIDAVYSN